MGGHTLNFGPTFEFLLLQIVGEILVPGVVWVSKPWPFSI